MRFPRLAATVMIATALSGCAGAPFGKGTDPKLLLSQACKPGAQTRSIKGSVWLKASSKDASGQFPAYVTVKDPASLRLEVTNLIGGTEAVITVDGQKYSIRSQNKKVRNEEGYGSWSGIPLDRSTDLFLGRIPCPAAQASADAKLAVTDEGELTVDTADSLQGAGERYVYRFRAWAGEAWPESLHWERKGKLATTVDFKFDDPEDGTRSPRKWEAKSSQGEVKVRWKDRDVVKN